MLGAKPESRCWETDRERPHFEGRGEALSDIARSYNVSQATISRLC